MSIRFSHTVKEIISLSREEVIRLGNDSIDTGHLLLALIREGNNSALRLLVNFNLDLPGLAKEIESAIDEKSGAGDKKRLGKRSSYPLTSQAENVIRDMVSEARSLKSPAVEPEHLLLAMLANRDSIAAKILGQFGVDYEKTILQLQPVSLP